MKKLEKQANEFAGNKIKSIRKLTGMTQLMLGKELGIAPQQIYKYEKGENQISAGKLFMLSQAVNVPVQYFFPQNTEMQEEPLAPKTVHVLKMLNRIPNEHFDDLTTVIRTILRISLKNEEVSKRY